MHKLVILISPRNPRNPGESDVVSGNQVQVYLYKRDGSLAWNLDAMRCCNYVKISGKICVRSHIVASGESNMQQTLLPVRVHINMKEWLRGNQVTGEDHPKTEVKVYLSVKSDDGVPLWDVHKIYSDKTVVVTVKHK